MPHFEFRFPLLGEVTYDGVELELRQAIEPWHVLGEEAAGGGTARYVDSSLERLQVKVRGMTDPRHLVALQRPPRAAASDRRAGRIRGRRAVPGLAAALLPAPHHRRPCAAGVRSYRPLVEALDRRLHWHVAHPGRPAPRDVPGQRLRGREPPGRAFFAMGHTAGPCADAAANRIATIR